MFKPRRLIWQLYPAYLLLVLSTLLAIGWYASGSMRGFYMSQTRQDLLNQAHLLSQVFLPLLEPLDQAAVDRRCKKTAAGVPTRLTVILPDGKVVGDSETAPQKMENHGNRPEIRQALTGQVGSAVRFSATLHHNMIYVAIPIGYNRITAILRVSKAMTDIEQQLHSLQVRLAVGSFIIALLASLGCLMISRRISRPIETLREGAARFARGDLTHRLNLPDTAELAELAHAMNQMAQDLQQRIQTIMRQRNESQAVLSSMMEGMMALDMEERIIQANGAAASLLNLSANRLQGRRVQEIMRSRQLQRMIQTTLSSGSATEGDVVLYQYDERVLNMHCSPLFDSDGQRMGILLVMNDVTQLRRLESMRSDFAANVSHEIKTPLTAIQGFVETLMHGPLSDSQETQRFLAIIHKHVLRLSAIIDDLMHLSRLEQDHGSAHLRLQSSSLHSMLGNAIQLCRASADAKQIEIVLDCDKGLAARMDADLMEQAAVNLLDNAIKYSPEASRVMVTAQAADQEIRIDFRDEGIGIAKRHLPRLFERFYRVDKARSRSVGGTGLGLAIVKHIVQAHNGRVAVDSVQGQGSTFTIHLPLAGQAPAGALASSWRRT